MTRQTEEIACVTRLGAVEDVCINIYNRKRYINKLIPLDGRRSRNGKGRIPHCVCHNAGRGTVRIVNCF